MPEEIFLISRLLRLEKKMEELVDISKLINISDIEKSPPYSIAIFRNMGNLPNEVEMLLNRVILNNIANPSNCMNIFLVILLIKL